MILRLRHGLSSGYLEMHPVGVGTRDAAASGISKAVSKGPRGAGARFPGVRQSTGQEEGRDFGSTLSAAAGERGGGFGGQLVHAEVPHGGGLSRFGLPGRDGSVAAGDAALVRGGHAHRELEASLRLPAMPGDLAGRHLLLPSWGGVVSFFSFCPVRPRARRRRRRGYITDSRSLDRSSGVPSYWTLELQLLRACSGPESSECSSFCAAASTGIGA